MGNTCDTQRYSPYCNNQGYLLYSAFYEKKCLCDKNFYGDVQRKPIEFLIDFNRNANSSGVKATASTWKGNSANATKTTAARTAKSSWSTMNVPI